MINAKSSLGLFYGWLSCVNAIIAEQDIYLRRTIYIPAHNVTKDTSIKPAWCEIRHNS